MKTAALIVLLGVVAGIGCSEDASGPGDEPRFAPTPPNTLSVYYRF